jgi:hypothetical protein
MQILLTVVNALIAAVIAGVAVRAMRHFIPGAGRLP